MITADARSALDKWADQRGVDIATLDARRALALALDWYVGERATDAHPLDEDGDGLLIEWGTFSFESPPTFQYSVCRQLITDDEADADEQAIWQVRLTVHYAVEAATSDLNGSTWIFDPADAPREGERLANHSVLDLLDGKPVAFVAVEFGRAD